MGRKRISQPMKLRGFMTLDMECSTPPLSAAQKMWHTQLEACHLNAKRLVEKARAANANITVFDKYQGTEEELRKRYSVVYEIDGNDAAAAVVIDDDDDFVVVLDDDEPDGSNSMSVHSMDGLNGVQGNVVIVPADNWPQPSQFNLMQKETRKRGNTSEPKWHENEMNASKKKKVPTDDNQSTGPVTDTQVPVEEYYYGKKEGDPSYWEEKGEMRFKCSFCNKTLYNNVRFVLHIEKHISIERQQNLDLSDLTQCRHCYRHFDTPFEMQRHLDTAHSLQSRYLCHICQKAHPDVNSFLQHMSSSHSACEMPYRCQLCNFQSSFYDDTIDHFRKRHDGSQFLYCSYCLRMYRTTARPGGCANTTMFALHMQKHQSKSIAKKCVNCKLVFLSKADLTAHQTKDHMPNYRGATGKSNTAATGGQVMMKLPQSGVKSNGPKSLNAQSVMRLQELTGLRLDISLGELTCLECNQSLTIYNHFKRHAECSLCRFATTCSQRYSEHMLCIHGGQQQVQITWSRATPLDSPMFCLCGYKSNKGNDIASHLIECSKRTCYSKEPEPRWVEVTEKKDHDVPFNPPAVLEPVGEQEESVSFLGALGLVKKSQAVRRRASQANTPQLITSKQVAESMIDVILDCMFPAEAAADEAMTLLFGQVDKEIIIGEAKKTKRQASQEEPEIPEEMTGSRKWQTVKIMDKKKPSVSSIFLGGKKLVDKNERTDTPRTNKPRTSRSSIEKLVSQSPKEPLIKLECIKPDPEHERKRAAVSLLIEKLGNLKNRGLLLKKKVGTNEDASEVSSPSGSFAITEESANSIERNLDEDEHSRSEGGSSEVQVNTFDQNTNAVVDDAEQVESSSRSAIEDGIAGAEKLIENAIEASEENSLNDIPAIDEMTVDGTEMDKALNANDDVSRASSVSNELDVATSKMEGELSTDVSNLNTGVSIQTSGNEDVTSPDIDKVCVSEEEESMSMEGEMTVTDLPQSEAISDKPTAIGVFDDASKLDELSAAVLLQTSQVESGMLKSFQTSTTESSMDVDDEQTVSGKEFVTSLVAEDDVQASEESASISTEVEQIGYDSVQQEDIAAAVTAATTEYEPVGWTTLGHGAEAEPSAIEQGVTTSGNFDSSAMEVDFTADNELYNDEKVRKFIETIAEPSVIVEQGEQECIVTAEGDQTTTTAAAEQTAPNVNVADSSTNDYIGDSDNASLEMNTIRLLQELGSLSGGTQMMQHAVSDSGNSGAFALNLDESLFCEKIVCDGAEETSIEQGHNSQ